MKATRYILLILVIICMLIIFMFSRQVAEQSKKASLGVSEKVVTTIYKNQGLTQSEIEKKSKSIEKPIRKMAHFSIFTLIGVTAYSFANTYNISRKRKIIYSLLFGIAYACTDEIHQLFVKGRSCEFRDICIDSLGVLSGIIVTELIVHNITKSKKNKSEQKDIRKI